MGPHSLKCQTFSFGCLKPRTVFSEMTKVEPHTRQQGAFGVHLFVHVCAPLRHSVCWRERGVLQQNGVDGNCQCELRGHGNRILSTLLDKQV